MIKKIIWEYLFIIYLLLCGLSIPIFPPINGYMQLAQKANPISLTLINILKSKYKVGMINLSTEKKKKENDGKNNSINNNFE
jgi:hypothetical protein